MGDQELTEGGPIVDRLGPRVDRLGTKSWQMGGQELTDGDQLNWNLKGIS